MGDAVGIDYFIYMSIPRSWHTFDIIKDCIESLELAQWVIQYELTYIYIYIERERERERSC